MKKLRWGVLLFLILVFVLSSWPSFLAFNQAERATVDPDHKKMAVALVNEDEGSLFNEEKLDFGQEFVRNIERDSNHNWYIVSRGVAENGLEQNLYNMMIVIPHDFTERALSIDSESPEKVHINYKINASESNEVRSKATETANKILNDFNRRIIDVYFASVIGNLQDAQDNIQSIVEKEAQYTNTYNQGVHSPLADYIAEFSVVQDNAHLSRDSFKGFKDDVLTSFETNLNDGLDTHQTFVSNFSDMLEVHKRNTSHTQDVFEGIDNLSENIKRGAGNIEEPTARIYRQFHLPEDRSKTDPRYIINHTKIISDFLEQALTDMQQLENNLKTNLEEKLEENLKAAFEESFTKENFPLNELLANRNSDLIEKLKNEVNKIPSIELEEDEMKSLGFSEETAKKLRDVMGVTAKFNDEFNNNFREESVPIKEQIKEIKKYLTETGVTYTDTQQIREANETKFKLSVSVPDEFYVSQLLVKLPGEETFSKVTPDAEITVSNSGQLTLKADFKLRENSSIELFNPIKWSWHLEEQKVDEGEGDDGEDSEGNQSEASEDGSAGEDDEGTKGQDDKATNEKPANVKTVVKEVQVETHNYSNTNESFLYKELNGELIQSAVKTVEAYQRITSLYELYFGLDFDEMNLEEITKLTDFASEQEHSLYYLFNTLDFMELLQEFIVDQMTEEVQKSFENIKNNIAAFYSLLEYAENNSELMADTIKRTREEAAKLDKAVDETLDKLGDWREASQKLVDGQKQVLVHDEEEQMEIAGLDQEFKSLLTVSQSLVEQAHSNLTSADHVFDTLETISKQAEMIQENGASIVNEANTLSTQLVEKLNNDKDFANNFVNVLANSRVGDRPNEDLYSFLSEPVKVKNDGIIMAGDTQTPYFLVLICFIVALFTAYVISHYEERRRKKENAVVHDTTLKGNWPLTAITAGIGVVEGLVICIISGYLLQITETKLMAWIGLIILMMVTMLLVATYLLRQLKMVGMFLLLMMLSIYLLLTNAISDVSQNSAFSVIKSFSPLQYVETMLMRFMQASDGYYMTIYGLVIILIISVIANLFVIHRPEKEEVGTDEGLTEAN